MIANAVTAFLDDRVGTGDGGSPAVVTADTTTTYAEVLALATRAGQGLRALGVEPEERVAVLLPDGLAWVATFFGALRIGAIAVPFNTRLSAAEWTDMLRDSRARVLVADAALARVVAGHHAELPHLRAIVDFTELVAGANDGLSPEPVGLDAMAFWLYTSGTTGAAKAAVHLHRDLLAGRPYGCDVLGASATDRVFATSKLFFAYALGNALLIPFSVGAQTYLSSAWAEPNAVAEIAASFRPTLLFSVPTFYGRLLRAGPPRRSSWCCRTGGAEAGRDHRDCRYPGRRRGCSMPTVAMSRTASKACSTCARRPPVRFTGTAWTNRARRSSASGFEPVTSTSVMPRASITIEAATMIGSRWPGCGSRRPTSSAHCPPIRQSPTPASSA